jgi:hypothetical protein
MDLKIPERIEWQRLCKRFTRRAADPDPRKNESANTLAICGHFATLVDLSLGGQGPKSGLAFASTRTSREVELIPPAGFLEEGKNPFKVTG